MGTCRASWTREIMESEVTAQYTGATDSIVNVQKENVCPDLYPQIAVSVFPYFQVVKWPALYESLTQKEPILGTCQSKLEVFPVC